MDALAKLRTVAPLALFEAAEDIDPLGRRATPLPEARELGGCIAHATLPGGAQVPMLKTMVSSACEMDCYYCPFRSGRDFRRETFTPDELAGLTQQLYTQGLVKGVFLSSGLVGGGVHTQDRVIAVSELLRRKYHFRGYLHAKIMPGAERAQIQETMRWADRVSLNLEAPNARRLADLAPHKRFADQLLQRLRWVNELRLERPPWERRPSVTTQYVVGAVGEPDVELLLTTAYLYRELGLARTYFSGFSPVSDTPLAEHPPIVLRREQRLYQASFLLRDYGFDVEDLPFGASGNLPLDADPKLAWAREHLSHAPIELNSADRHVLLRIPGVGLKSADRILAERRRGTLNGLGDLRKLGIRADRAAPFILLAGNRPVHQLSLWPAARAD